MRYLTTYKLFESESFDEKDEIIDILQDIKDYHFYITPYKHTGWVSYNNLYGKMEFDSPITITIDMKKVYDKGSVMNTLDWVDIRDSILHLRNWAIDKGYKYMYLFNVNRDSNRYINQMGLIKLCQTECHKLQ